ncbi:MAG: hypothetical protein MJ025_05165 [Victivallaceae bacterium]|nr:hypothetical protein [Victivallaceae bacterium]
MSRSAQIYTAIEFGTSKASVLVGRVDENDAVEVLAFETTPWHDVVIKGEIRDFDRARQVIGAMLDKIGEHGNTCFVVVTGCDIHGEIGKGSVNINRVDHAVIESDLDAASNQSILTTADDRQRIISLPARVLLNGTLANSNVIGLTAERLEVHTWTIHGNATRLYRYKTVLKNVGFDDKRIFEIYAPVADAYALIQDDEQLDGALLIDYGAGCTEFIVENRHGLAAIGHLQVGFEHVINDMSVAFDVPNKNMREFVEAGKLDVCYKKNKEGVKQSPIPYRQATKKRKDIDVNDMLEVCSQRIFETFDIVRQMIQNQNIDLRSVGYFALTGGAAKSEMVKAIFEEVFSDKTCHVRRPYGMTGVTTGIETPANSAIYGVLKMARGYAGQLGISDDEQSDKVLGVFSTLRNAMLSPFWRNRK